MTRLSFDVVLVGGGLQNGLIALALVQHAPNVRMALVESSGSLGGNHIWCFHEQDVPSSAETWVEPLVEHRWDEYEVRFPNRHRVLKSSYRAVTSSALDKVVQHCFSEPQRGPELGQRELRLGQRATEVSANRVVLDSGEQLQAPLVVDARGPERHTVAHDTGYQKFLGLEMEFEQAHGVTRPTVMDATVAQSDGFRFFYRLPLSPKRLMIEDTYFSDTPDFDPGDLRNGIVQHALHLGLTPKEIVREETGVLPLPKRSRTSAAQPGPLQAGYQGGWFHPTTGYSFPIAVRLAELIATTPQAELQQRVAVLREHHGRQFRFGLLLNRLLFDALAPEHRYQALERFYGLPEPLIARFYSMNLSSTDRMRVLCGRPPRDISFRRALTEGLLS